MLSLEFLKPLVMSAYKLSNKMNVSYKRMIDILKNESSLTEKEYLFISAIFNTDVCLWWNLRNNYNDWAHSKYITLRD